MAKKFGKFLLGTACLTAVTAAVMIAYTKYKEKNDDFDDELADFEENDFEDDVEPAGEYVSLKRDLADGLSDITEDISDAADNIKDDIADVAEDIKDDITGADSEKSREEVMTEEIDSILGLDKED